MKRLFTAIPITLSDEIIQHVDKMQQLFSDEKIRWVPPENIHLTLKFFGNTPGESIPRIQKALLNATSATEPFSMEINKLGVFGSRYAPRVIWLGMDPHTDILHLKTRVFDELQQINISSDRQNFIPHISLARITQLKHKRYFQEQLQVFKERFHQQIEINAIHLYEAILQKPAVKYNIIDTFHLKP